jgi:hypothetical protein
MKSKIQKEKGGVEKVKLISGLIMSEGVDANDVYKLLKGMFSEIDFKSDIINFDYTDYYYPEMGKPLRRQFVSFKKLVSPGDLARFKVIANKIEKKFSSDGKRKVNIDPGYIEPSKLVLASTKNFFHRIYLGQGIYGEVTLCWRNKEYRYFEWTFPDYRTDEYRDILKQIRERYIKQLEDKKSK